MAIRTILWTTTEPLVCAPCPTSTSSVIICLPALKVNYFNCPIDPLVPPEVTLVGDYPMGTINGEIQNYAPLGSCSFQYTITYDDVQLIPNVVITSDDIIGVICRDCIAAYIDQQAGNDVKLEIVDGIYRLTSQHGCQYEFGPSSSELLARVIAPVNSGSTTNYFDITYLDLSIGIWEVSGSVTYVTTSLATGGWALAAIGLYPGNNPTGLQGSYNLSSGPMPIAGNAINIIVFTHQITVTVTPSRYYLKGKIPYIDGLTQHVATFRAKRIG